MELLRAEGWFVIDARASRGPADLVALKGTEWPKLVQVKATARAPFHSFGPRERAELSRAAEAAGAVAELAWWPPDRKGLRWYPEASWPPLKRKDPAKRGLS